MMIYRLFVLGSELAPRLPVWLGNAISKLIGLLLYLLLGNRRRVVMCNLSYVLADQPLAERKRVARRIFQYNIRSYYDMLRAHKIPLPKLAQMVEVRGLDELKAQAAQNGNKGIICISAHVGSFSLCPQVSTYNDVTFYLLVEPIKPPKFFELVRKLRQIDPRMRTISVASGEIRQIFKALKEHHAILCFAIDRDVIGTGTEMDFFGGKAKIPTGAAEVALRSGAVVVPLHVFWKEKDNCYCIEFWHERTFVAKPTGDKAADVQRVARQMIGEVERVIRSTPDQWIVTQPIWPEC